MNELSTKLERDLESCNEIEKELTCNILNFITWDHPEAARYTDMRNSMELPKALFSRLVDMLRSHGWVTTTTGTGIYEGVLCLAATSKLLELNEILRGKKENDNPTEQKGEIMDNTNVNKSDNPIMGEIKKLFPLTTSEVQKQYCSVFESLFRNYPKPISKKEMCDGDNTEVNRNSYCVVELIKIGYVERISIIGEKAVGNNKMKYVATEKLMNVYSSHGISAPEEIKVDESQLDESTRVQKRLQEEFPSCSKNILSALKYLLEFIYLCYPKKITTKDVTVSDFINIGSRNYILNLLYDRGYVIREGYDPSKKKNNNVSYMASSKLIELYEPINTRTIIEPITEKGEISMLNDTNFKVKETLTGEEKSTYFRYLNRIMCYICSRIPTNTYTERYFLHLLCLQDVIIEGKPFPKEYSDIPFYCKLYFWELKDQGYLNVIGNDQYQVTDKAIEIYKKYMSEKDSTDPDYTYRKTLPFIDFTYEHEYDSLWINFMLYLLGKNYPNSLTRKDIIHLLGNELMFTATRGMKLYTYLEAKGYITITYGKGSTPHTYKATDKTLCCYGLNNPDVKKNQDTSIDNPTSVTPKGDNEMSVSVIKPVDAPSSTHKVSDTVQVNKSIIADEKSEVTLNSIDEKLNTILSRMDKMDERVDSVLGEVSTVFKAIDTINGRIAEVHQEIHQVGVRTTESMEVLSSIRMNVSIPNDQITGLRTDFRQLWEKLSAVDTKMNAFDNRLLYIDKHTEKIDTIMDSMTELVEKVDNLENVEEVPAPKTVYVRQPSQGGEVFDSKFSYIYTQLSSINTQMMVLVDGMEQLKEQRVVKDPIGKEEVPDQEDGGEDFTDQFLKNLFSPWPTDDTKMDSPFKRKVQQVPFTFPHMESFNNKTKDIRQLAYDEVRDNILQVVHNFRRTGLEEVRVGIFISPSYLIQTPLEKSKGHFNVLGVEVDTLSVVKMDIPKNSIIWDNPLLDVMATIKKTFPVSDSAMGQNHTSVSDIVVEYMAYGDAPMCAITFKLNKM